MLNIVDLYFSYPSSGNSFLYSLLILTIEPLDTTYIVNVLADLLTPFDCLTNSDTNTGNANLSSAYLKAEYYKDPACFKY